MWWCAAAVRQRLESFGTTPVSSTREELAAFLRAEMARWGEVVRTGADSGLGRIAAMVATATPRRTPLQRRLSGLSRRLAGFGWWTIEYGVLRSSGGTKCYGAAIFSSLSEASRFRAGGYRLQALTASAFDLPYDATAEQSQLFIADGLEHVAELLDQLEAEACAADAGEPVERRDPPAADCAE